MKLITEGEIKRRFNNNEDSRIKIDSETLVTPAAKDYASSNGILIERIGRDEIKEMPTAIDKGCKYVNYVTGETYDHKPEDMTHLHGVKLVNKAHRQIELRGKLDSLEAKIMETQLVACGDNKDGVVKDLDEMLSFTREILASEVKETPLAGFSLLGMDGDEVRRTSHYISEVYGIPHPTPDFRMGSLCVSLNTLRTSIRETELAAVRAFQSREGTCRMDIVTGLNRLSSCAYIIFCRLLAGYYDDGR